MYPYHNCVYQHFLQLGITTDTKSKPADYLYSQLATIYCFHVVFAFQSIASCSFKHTNHCFIYLARHGKNDTSSVRLKMEEEQVFIWILYSYRNYSNERPSRLSPPLLRKKRKYNSLESSTLNKEAQKVSCCDQKGSLLDVKLERRHMVPQQ